MSAMDHLGNTRSDRWGALDDIDGEISQAFWRFWADRDRLEKAFLAELKALGHELEQLGVKVDTSEDNLDVVRSCLSEYCSEPRSDELDVYLSLIQGTVYDANGAEEQEVA
jgi:hypothetical protein